MKVNELKTLFVESIGSNSDETRRSYDMIVCAFTNTIGEIAEVTYPKYVEWKSTLCDYSVATQRKYISVTKEFLQWCFVNYDIGNASELFKIDKIKSPRGNSKQTQPLTTEEIKKMVSFCTNDRDKAIIMLGCITGLRVNEIIELKLDDIKSGYIEVCGKGNKHRTVFPNDVTMNMLNTYINGMRTKKVAQKHVELDNVFISNTGSIMSESSLNRTLKSIAKRVGINKDIHPHSLRHTCATLMYENGLDIVDIQTNLGHADISTTKRYIHGNVNTMQKKLATINMLG